ncbi:hypothetical protein DY000_02037294 [Brassica cretica]|uniref:Uncharacterized protein n=1 Tax=Brassica cretica TaxID=69181 RepID=A0ABQ7B6C1_BRACR|nr:hypothetical protein DY000_02037294 [Brassica cretica]
MPWSCGGCDREVWSRTTELSRVERESRSKIESGERPTRERACRRRSPSNNRKDVGYSLLFRFLCPPTCLSSGSGLICGGSASRLKAQSCGGSYSSVAAGPCLREVEASSAPPSSVLSSGSEGSLSLASPALGVSSDELSIGSMKLSEVKTKRGSEEMVSMEALR